MVPPAIAVQIALVEEHATPHATAFSLTPRDITKVLTIVRDITKVLITLRGITRVHTGDIPRDIIRDIIRDHMEAVQPIRIAHTAGLMPYAQEDAWKEETPALAEPA